MRVAKDKDGEFYVVDEPLVLIGEAAAEFRRQMEERDKRGNTPEEQAFLDECERIYRSVQERMAKP